MVERDWIVTELFGVEAVQSVLQQVAQNPQLMTNMLQAPYVQAMLQSMSSNPELVLQVNCQTSCYSAGLLNT